MKKYKNIAIFCGTTLFLLTWILLILLLLLFPDANFIYVYILLFLEFIVFLYSLFLCIFDVCHNNKFSIFDKIQNIFLLILFNLFYVPIYYIKYMSDIKFVYGVFNSIIYVIAVGLSFYFLFSFKHFSESKFSVYKSNDNVLTLKINKLWNCTVDDIGGNNLYCYKKYDKDSLGIFNYTDFENTDELVSFHINQSIDILKEEGYKLIKKEIDNKNRFTIVTMKKNGSEIVAVTAVKFDTKDYTTIVNYYGYSIEEFKEIFKNIL